MYVRVALDRPLADPYTYSVPEPLRERAVRGAQVLVPLGRGTCTGFVVQEGVGPPPSPTRARDILEVQGEVPAAPADLMQLAEWMARYSMVTVGEALSASVPPYAPARRSEVLFHLVEPDEAEAGPAPVTSRPAPRQEAVLRYVEQQGGVAPQRQVQKALGNVAGPVRALLEKGRLRKETKVLEVGAAIEEGGLNEGGRAQAHEPLPRLTGDQRRAVEAVMPALNEGRPETFVLRGVTGSGKTEVYLALVRECLDQGRGAIVLVPEIALTVPMIDRFRHRFGQGVAVFHSQLTARQRYSEWVRVRTGLAPVVLGARSAVFAPVPSLGLIVIDEEHETSYKQGERPCYHARVVARARARIQGFPVLLGSATPALESTHPGEAGGKRGTSLVLPRRYRGRPMPDVELVDMGREYAVHRNRSIFSMRLKEEMGATLEAGRQVLLFINRRGHSTHVFCRACGHVMRCAGCEVSLTWHQADRISRCHLCGFEKVPPPRCPQCEDRAFRYCGSGTQKVEQEVRLNFPGVTLRRMDRDTTRRRGAHKEIVRAYAEGRAQVLIGTQMVTKGFDFPELDLVGVVNADLVLHQSDFRGAERTFQLVTQVAGRAGRGDRPGRVIVQTYEPRHYALVAAQRHDYEAFARMEIPRRKELSYPPFSRLVSLLAESRHEERACGFLAQLAARLREGLEEVPVLGPSPARVPRIDERYRFQILLKMPLDEESPARSALKALLDEARVPTGVAFKIDVDPL